MYSLWLAGQFFIMPCLSWANCLLPFRLIHHHMGLGPVRALLLICAHCVQHIFAWWGREWRVGYCMPNYPPFICLHTQTPAASKQAHPHRSGTDQGLRYILFVISLGAETSLSNDTSRCKNQTRGHRMLCYLRVQGQGGPQVTVEAECL